MKIIFCLCVGLIFIYLCHLDCYVCFCNFWGIQLTAVIIPYFFFFFELRGCNVYWWCYFQEYVIQRLPAKCQTYGSFGKHTIVEVICSKSKGFRIWMGFSPNSCRAFRSILLQICTSLTDQLTRGFQYVGSISGFTDSSD